MNIKIFGSILIILSCGGVGFGIANSNRKETCTLRSLIRVLSYIECELEYRLTPLPELLHSARNYCTGSLGQFFADLSNLLRLNDQPNVQACITTAINNGVNLPKSCVDALTQLGETLGCFGLSGQLEGLRSVRTGYEQILQLKITDQDKRLRSYQTLSLCAGAALVILFI